MCVCARVPAGPALLFAPLHAAHSFDLGSRSPAARSTCDVRSYPHVHVFAHPTAPAHLTARARRTRWSVVRVLILVSYAYVMSVARLVVGNRPDPAVNSLLEFMSSVGAMSMQVPLLPLGRVQQAVYRCGKY